MHDKYILNGHTPVVTDDLFAWAEWFEGAEENRRVALTEISDDVSVSTVFLGLDHNFSGEGDPILFETMVFGGDRDGETTRYRTWDEAKTGHEEVVSSFTAK